MKKTCAEKAMKAVKEKAAAIIKEKQVEIFTNEDGSSGISFKSIKYDSQINKILDIRKTIRKLRRIDVEIFREKRDSEIEYFVQIYKFGVESGEINYEIFKIVNSAEMAYEIQDMLDDMIKANESSMKL